MDEKVYRAIISGQSDNNIKYTDFQKIIVDLGFEFKRQKGSHRTYYHYDIGEYMNIQPMGNKAKGYQVAQLREYIKEYDL